MIKRKKKRCPTCGEQKYLFSRKVGCIECVNRNKFKQSTEKQYKPQKITKSQFANQKSKIKPVSDKRKKESAEYQKVRLEYLNNKPNCEVCGNPATEVHHKNNKRGSRLTDTKYFLSSCRDCHRKIHDNPRWAEENGYLIRGRNTN